MARFALVATTAIFCVPSLSLAETNALKSAVGIAAVAADYLHTAYYKGLPGLVEKGTGDAIAAAKRWADSGQENKLPVPISVTSEGQVDASEFRELLARFEKLDREHSNEISELRNALKDRMTKQEAERILMDWLERYDRKLAEVVKKVHEQQEALYAHQKILDEYRSDITQLYKSNKDLFKDLKGFQAQVNMELKHQSIQLEYQGLRIEQESARLGRTEREMQLLREDYPRWAPNEQSEHLAVAGMRYLITNDNREALRAFRFAHAYDPTEPGCLYGLAVSYRRDGQKEAAENLLAQGVIAERRRSLMFNRWWAVAIERFQGKDRSWIESARRDPVYGVYVRGNVRVPSPAMDR